MSAPFLLRFVRLWPAWAALLFMGLLVWLMLPGMVVVLDDDFWYLRSVIKTIQKGRPWTDEWLTPWAASASGLSALIFKLTGSFKLAIHFQLAGAAGLAAMAASLFLKRQGTGPLVAFSTPVLLLATPTVLFMFLMFTGVALYMACLWWCLLLADRRKWLWFLLPWGLAVASRQSAVAWLALPGWALLQEAWIHRRLIPTHPVARRLWATFVGAAAVFLLCKLGMNPTTGQKLALGGIGQAIFTPQVGMPLALGGLAWLAGLGLAALVRSLQPGSLLLQKNRLLWAPVLACAGAAGAWWFRRETLNTHDCYSDNWSALIIPGFGAVLGLALAFNRNRPRPDATLAALGSMVLVALYGGRFDYYFIDALVLGLAAGFPPAVPAPEGGKPAQKDAPGPSFSPWPRRVAGVLFGVLSVTTLLWHSRSVARMTAQQERGAATIRIYEQAMRSGKLAPEHVGMASFGYLGWLFQDYYAAHDGQENPVLGGFSRYAQNWEDGRGTGILTTLPKSLRAWRDIIPSRNRAALRDTPGVPVLLELEAPLFGRFPVRYTLLRGPSEERVPGTLPFHAADYQRIPFPLTDAEWRHLILEQAPLP